MPSCAEIVSALAKLRKESRMSFRGQIAVGTLLSSGAVALVLAGLGGYVSLTNSILERTTPAAVEHIIDLKTADKLAETNRRLAHLEEQLERVLQAQAQRMAHARSDPEDWPKPGQK